MEVFNYSVPTTLLWAFAFICASFTLLKWRSIQRHPLARFPGPFTAKFSNSWKDIYDKRKGHSPFIKSDFYDGGNFAAEAHSIVSVRDPDEHAQMRRYLRDAFSDRSLREQEYLISQVIDHFIDRIGEEGGKPDGIDIVMWFNLTTFDIIGSLAFGQSFGGVSSGLLASYFGHFI
ncbi:unnamed protein product [Colletotrichum noveboracense]|uniref:Benzoate 4-monooxygenase cytochrome P450 n=1 Tax=Colletotrichum noveboracense TaxID=2664923 RepID=A0A9W4W7G3_9PEZI|nr:unnamed protein product [Colletotrichum noveboracense]